MRNIRFRPYRLRLLEGLTFGWLLFATLLATLAAAPAAAQTDIRPAPAVNVTKINGAAVATGNGTAAGAQRVAIASDNSAVAVTPAGNAAAGASATLSPVLGGCVYTASPLTLSDGKAAYVPCDSRDNIKISIAGFNGVGGVAVAASNADGSAVSASNALYGLGLVFNGTTADRMRGNASGVFTVPQAVTSGGLSIARLVGATSGVIKASAGQLYTCSLTNTNAATRYAQLYNKATAGTLSTDTPVVTITLPPSVPVTVNVTDLGAAFATGISWQFTTDDVAIPTTAGATTDIHGLCTFK